MKITEIIPDDLPETEGQLLNVTFDRIEKLEADKKRIDWLADKDNEIGNVQLPTACVENNLSSLRDAIDAAMLL